MRMYLPKIAVATVFVTALALAAVMYPEINVDFQHPVNVGTETLGAGHYTFRQVPTRTNTPVFRVEKPDGTNVALTAIAISAKTPPNSTSNMPAAAQNSEIVLQKVNGTYYLDKIWVQGRARGWEFNIPESAKAQGQMQQETVNGSYQESNSSNSSQ